jgi:hypothetical protein
MSFRSKNGLLHRPGMSMVVGTRVTMSVVGKGKESEVAGDGEELGVEGRSFNV